MSTAFEDFNVQVQRGGSPPDGAQLELADWAARELRHGIELGDPKMTRVAQEIVNRLDGGGSEFGLVEPGGARPSLDSSLSELTTRLEQELLAGRLLVERQRLSPLSERRDRFEGELPPLPPAARRDTSTRTFEVRFVDEVGRAISGIDAEFTADGAQTRATNAAGIALLDGVQSSKANVAILDPDALSKALDPRWERFRPGKPPKEANTTEVVFRGAELGPFDLKAELPNTVVIKPPLGKLFVELWDKTGRVRHANRTYQITGPQSFEGKTDDAGRLLHENVLPGDYTLQLRLEFFKGDRDEASETVDSQLIVLEPGVGEPQVRLLASVPRSILARLRMFFNTNKAFLLPTALPSLLKLRRLYIDNAPCELLVVGHADTKGGAVFNDKLSLQRAEATIAYLKDDVQAWYDFYSLNDTKQCWGKVEDHLMIAWLPDFDTKPKGEDEVRWFQRTRKLEVDGDAGKETRTKLIAEYMSLDGTSLEDFIGDINATAHGCGENFPLGDDGEELDAAPDDEKRDPEDRRVELYFFDAEFGITPKPPGTNSQPGSPEYPKWRERVAAIVELQENDPDAPTIETLRLAAAHFRTDSAVILPEGETPDASRHSSLSSVGVFAAALVFAEENPNKRVVVAGHTDTKGSEEHNEPLSRERADCALACLVGARSDFVRVCDQRHKTGDVKQILSWAAQRFGFACAPKKVDDVAATLAQPLEAFQVDYNASRSLLGVPAALPVKADGKLRAETWGAIFDCYEAALAAELSQADQPSDRLTELGELRKNLLFVDNANKSLGFGEAHPIDELGRDEVESQPNRRVELMFFEKGIELDLEAPAEESEIFLPGNFNPVRLPALAEGEAVSRGDTLAVSVLDELGVPIVGAPFQLTLPGGRVVDGVLDASGVARALAVPPGESTLVCTIDESLLPQPVDGAEDVVTASELAAGVAVPAGVGTLRVGLGELLIPTDFDVGEQEDMLLTLTSDDGAFNVTLTTQQDGIATGGGIDVLFTAMPTVGKTYTLQAAAASEAPDIVFSGLDFAQIQAFADQLSEGQIEPGRGTSDERISELDPGQGDDPLENEEPAIAVV